MAGCGAKSTTSVFVAAACGGALVLGRFRGGELPSSSESVLGGFRGSFGSLVSGDGDAMLCCGCDGASLELWRAAVFG